MTSPYYFRVSVAVLVTALTALILTLTGTKPAEAAFPGSQNGKIVFYSWRTTGAGVDNPEGDLEIFSMNPDGTGLTQLTKNTEDDRNPAWSANGQRIAFESDRSDGGVSDNSEIYTMDKDGSNQVRLTNDPTGGAWFDDVEPAWSPDGTKIAWERGPDIYVMRVEDDDADGNGDGRRRLTKKSTTFDGTPAWSPDGTKIAFQSDRSGLPQIHVMKAKPEGKKNRPRNISKDPAGAYEPNWSPDGTKIAFRRGQAGISSGEIYTMNKDGTDKVRLTQNQVHDSAPSWSPDGTKIAFTGFRTNLAANDPTYQILAMDSADGHPESQLTFGNPLFEGNWGPDWALRLE